MIKKVFIFSISIICSLFLLNEIYWGYTNHVLFHFSPFVKHLPNKENVKYVYIRDVQHPDQYVLLTDDPTVIEELLNDLKWTWHTNLATVPTGERELEIIFDDDNDPSAHNGLVRSYSKSNKLSFYGNVDWFVSLESSNTLKNLLAQHTQLQ